MNLKKLRNNKEHVMFVLRKINVIQIVVFFVTVLAINGACKRNKYPLSTKKKELAMPADSGYLFNGINLDGWEITNFGPQGPVYVSGGSVILGMGEGCTGITWKGSFPENNYIVTLDAKRVSGNDFFCGITFPVDSSFCSLIVGGWGGAVVGLSSINRLDASENSTKTIMNFETGKWYNICLLVKKDTIRASIDRKVVVNFAIDGNRLSIRPEVQLSRPFGITSWTTTAAIRNLKMKKL
ncbi:MAG TPA: DUF1080 domain-containing protein [Bacteroidales bacterium]|nr:DUF1080 domain-containing protein [Bacteroidales bacterium]